jgi:hypothetical protein
MRAQFGIPLQNLKCEELGESCYTMINAVELCDNGSAFDDQYLCLCGAYHLYLPAVISPYHFLMSPVHRVHECDGAWRFHHRELPKST